MEKVKFLYVPDEATVNVVEVFGVNYPQFTIGPKVIVVEALEKRTDDIVLCDNDDMKIVYDLRDCHYTEREGKIHIEFKTCTIHYKD